MSSTLTGVRRGTARILIPALALSALFMTGRVFGQGTSAFLLVAMVVTAMVWAESVEGLRLVRAR